MVLDFLLVFISVVFADLIWVFYIRKVNQGKEYMAGGLAVLLSLSSAYVTVAYVDNQLFIIPTFVGAFVGTVIAIKLDKKYRK